jgi:tetratricopeptide (TPR) repeat protein
MAYAVAQLDDIDALGTWIPVRRQLGIEAFGVNAWRADAGEDVIAEHTEEQNRHQELYLVLAGRATFTVDGEDVDAPVGTLVALADPAARRKAVAQEDGTTVLAVGGPAGEAYALPAWEWNAEAIPLFATGEYDRAREILLAGLELQPRAGGILYNLACAEARVGNADEALAYLERAVEIVPRFGALARDDEDLASLREDERFSAVTGQAEAAGAGA